MCERCKVTTRSVYLSSSFLADMLQDSFPTAYIVLGGIANSCPFRPDTGWKGHFFCHSEEVAIIRDLPSKPCKLDFRGQAAQPNNIFVRSG